MSTPDSHHLAAEILQRRAAALALPPPTAAEDAHGALRVCDFSIAGQSCAIAVGWLKEVRPLKDLTLLPVPAPHVMGAVNVRGRMVPVLQLAGMLGDRAHGPGAGWMLVLAGEGVEFAVAADAIGTIETIDATRVARWNARMENLDTAIVEGCGPGGCFILDGRALAALAMKGRGDLPQSPLSQEAS